MVPQTVKKHVDVTSILVIWTHYKERRLDEVANVLTVKSCKDYGFIE